MVFITTYCLFCSLGQSIKRSLATRLAFDETMEQDPGSARKLSRLDADILGGWSFRIFFNNWLQNILLCYAFCQDTKYINSLFIFSLAMINIRSSLLNKELRSVININIGQF